MKTGVDEALASVTDTATDAQALMNDIGGEVRTHHGVGADRSATNLNRSSRSVRQGRGTRRQVADRRRALCEVKAITADAQKAVANLREASEEAKAAIADLRGDNGPMKGITGDLQQTLNSARDAMADLAENTEALKRNFFFRGFFNKRGYFDLDDVSVQQYRQGALETKDRRVLRIWFERRRAVRARCERGGALERRRHGSASIRPCRSSCATRRTSPFVVEGYALEHDRGRALSHQPDARPARA